MKSLSTSLAFLLFIIGSACSANDKVSLKKFKYKGKELTYSVQLPNDFDASKTYPVLIGPSEVEGDNLESFYWKGTKQTYGWILINYPIYSATKRVDEIKALLDHIKSTYKVEGDKFHTVCFSANSAGIFDLVMKMPTYFAGITGMAGNPRPTDEDQLNNLKGIKVQFVVGDKDNYWMNAAKKRHEILLEMGVESTIEIIKNGKHVMSPLIGKGFLERASRLR